MKVFTEDTSDKRGEILFGGFNTGVDNDKSGSIKYDFDFKVKYGMHYVTKSRQPNGDRIIELVGQAKDTSGRLVNVPAVFAISNFVDVEDNEKILTLSLDILVKIGVADPALMRGLPQDQKNAINTWMHDVLGHEWLHKKATVASLYDINSLILNSAYGAGATFLVRNGETASDVINREAGAETIKQVKKILMDKDGSLQTKQREIDGNVDYSKPYNQVLYRRFIITSLRRVEYGPYYQNGDRRTRDITTIDRIWSREIPEGVKMGSPATIKGYKDDNFDYEGPEYVP